MSRKKKPLVLEPTVVIIEPDEATIRRRAEQMWKDLISNKTKSAMAKKRANGEFCGGNSPKYGYSFDNDKKLIPNEQEQNTIRIVCDLRKNGLSLNGIIAELLRIGVVSRNGKPFQPIQIRRILYANVDVTLALDHQKP
ncbi:MAG: hypothetical protein E6Q97_06250 [Desulfurellales bacterium]|nr:MAG: hypothetical protein E6Q97_06250 [Desulfurellales bacterium]